MDFNLHSPSVRADTVSIKDAYITTTKKQILTIFIEEKLIKAQTTGLLPYETVHVLSAVIINSNGILERLDTRLQAERNLGVSHRVSKKKKKENNNNEKKTAVNDIWSNNIICSMMWLQKGIKLGHRQTWFNAKLFYLYDFILMCFTNTLGWNLTTYHSFSGRTHLPNSLPNTSDKHLSILVETVLGNKFLFVKFKHLNKTK